MDPESSIPSNSSFEWSQPEAFHRRHQLSAEGRVVGGIAFERGFGSLANAQYGAQTWTFKRTGFFSPRVTVRQGSSENDAAIFTPVWNGGGTVEFAGGRRFRLRSTSFWGSDWVFEDERGNVVVSLHGPTGFLKSGGRTVVAQGLPEAPVLVLLLWYIRLLMNEDAAVIVTT